MNLPQIVRTKAEAEALAAEIIPTNADALATLRHARPVVVLPRYSLDFANAAALRQVFEWLASRQTRILAPARWPLFYALANRFVFEVDENGQSKVRDIWFGRQNNLNYCGYVHGHGEGI